MNHTELIEMLAGKYRLPHWLFLSEVRNDTSFYSTRSVDGLAIGLYDSKGQDIIGFEAKATRNDWLTELQKPEKSAEVSRFCDYWYLVAAGPEVAKAEELPATWGLMLPTKKGNLRAAKMAAKLKAEPLSRGLFSKILQDAMRQTRKETEDRWGVRSIEAKISEEREDARKQERESCARQVQVAEDGMKKLKAQLDEFEKVSGIRIDGWNGTREIGLALRAIREGEPGLKRIVEQMEFSLERAKDRMKELLALHEGFRKLKELFPRA